MPVLLSLYHPPINGVPKLGAMYSQMIVRKCDHACEGIQLHVDLKCLLKICTKKACIRILYQPKRLQLLGDFAQTPYQVLYSNKI